MDLCEKCIIRGVLQNGSTFAIGDSADQEADRVQLHLEFFFALDTDDEEAKGQRRVEFDGTVSSGTILDGVVDGTLSGHFDVYAERKISAPARVEVFNREGLVSFLNVSVEDDDGQATFSANIRPSLRLIDPGIALGSGLRGTVFLGWNRGPQSAAD